MRSRSPEPKGKLDAMTGYSFTTPVWDGGAWVTPAVAEVRVAARRANGPEDQPCKQDAPAEWDKIDWRAHEGQGRGVRQPVFYGAQGQGWPKGREPQKLKLSGPGNTLGRGPEGKPRPPGGTDPRVRRGGPF